MGKNQIWGSFERLWGLCVIRVLESPESHPAKLSVPEITAQSPSLDNAFPPLFEERHCQCLVRRVYLSKEVNFPHAPSPSLLILSGPVIRIQFQYVQGTNCEAKHVGTRLTGQRISGFCSFSFSFFSLSSFIVHRICLWRLSINSGLQIADF